jgi:hypothetical protein
MRYEPRTIWETSVPGSYRAIATASDNVYLGGYLYNYAYDGPNNSYESWYSASIASYNDDASQNWHLSIQLDDDKRQYSQVNDIAVDDYGNVFIAGTSINLDYSNISNEGFLAKISSSGELLWKTTSGIPVADGFNAIALGKNGEIFVGGYESAFQQEGQPYAAKIWIYSDPNADGDLELDGSLYLNDGSWGSSQVNNLAYSEGETSLYAVGQGPSPANSSIFVSKLDYSASGDSWNHYIDDIPFGNAVDLALAPTGGVYVFGSASISAFGQPTTGYNDAFLSHLDEAGLPLWDEVITAEGNQTPKSIAVTDDGTIVLSGSTEGPIDGLNVDYAQFLTQYDANGAKLETTTVPGWWSYQSKVAVAPDQQLYYSDESSLKLIDLSDPQPVQEIPALFSYRLLKIPTANAQTTNYMDVYAFGNLEDQNRRYYLEISADTGLSGNIGLASVDLTISFNKNIFNALDQADVNLSASPLSQLQKIAVDNQSGTVRFTAGSAEAINTDGDSLGQAIRNKSILGYIAFDLNDAALSSLIANEGYLPGTTTRRTESANFSISANLDETIFTDLESLRDKHAYELNYSASGPNVKAMAVIMDLTQQGSHRFGTQRETSLVDGETGFTNLIREGDVVTASAYWKNTGDMGVTGIQYSTKTVENATISVGQSFSDISIGYRDSEGNIYEDYRPTKEVTATIKASDNGAGHVIDTSQGLYIITEASGEFDWVAKGSKNLITYQGDLNYDGRVSMKDLAFLNAGATVWDGQTGTAAGDVDADHDGEFTIADLEVLDRQWGQSLHTGAQTFEGMTSTADNESAISWDELASQTIINEKNVGMAMQWDNSPFVTQNAIEASSGFSDTLTDSSITV